MAETEPKRPMYTPPGHTDNEGVLADLDLLISVRTLPPAEQAELVQGLPTAPHKPTTHALARALNPETRLRRKRPRP